MSCTTEVHNLPRMELVAIILSVKISVLLRKVSIFNYKRNILNR